MDAEQRKALLRKELILRRTPRRANAVFTAENDHNPTVLASCRECRGYGRYDTFRETDGRLIQELHKCEACGGTGVKAETEPYFNNDNEPIAVAAEPNGWLRCPNCGWKFSITSKDAFTGLRHKRCGQKLHVTNVTR